MDLFSGITEPVLRTDAYQYLTRTKNHICLHFSATTFEANQVLVKGLQLFNVLPLDIKNEVIYSTFKRLCLEYVKQTNIN